MALRRVDRGRLLGRLVDLEKHAKMTDSGMQFNFPNANLPRNLANMWYAHTTKHIISNDLSSLFRFHVETNSLFFIAEPIRPQEAAKPPAYPTVPFAEITWLLPALSRG